MKPAVITNNLPELHKLIHDNDIDYLALFGSFSRGEQKIGSDLDMLVSFKKRKGMLEFIGLENKIELTNQ